MPVLLLTRKKPRETRLWQFDPAVFRPGRKAGHFERHLLAPARSVAKHTLYVLAFAYPILLVTLGLLFGGLVFWSSLAGSMLVVWIVLKKTGYARNFEDWDIGYRKFLGLTIAFGMTVLFVYSLGYTPLKIMTIPIMGGALALVLILAVWRAELKSFLYGRLNKLTGLGIITMLSPAVLFSLDPTTIVVNTAQVPLLRVLDLERTLLSVGIVILFAGAFQSMRPPKKTLVGFLVSASILFYTTEVYPATARLFYTTDPVTAWIGTLSISLVDVPTAVQIVGIAVGLVVTCWGFLEARIPRTRHSALEITTEQTEIRH